MTEKLFGKDIKTATLTVMQCNALTCPHNSHCPRPLHYIFCPNTFLIIKYTSMARCNKENNVPAGSESAHDEEVPAAPSKKNQGKAKKDHAVWSINNDQILMGILLDARGEGRQTSNGSWHSDVWKTAEKRQAGTEMHSGGTKKTAASCMNHWQNVCNINSLE